MSNYGLSDGCAARADIAVVNGEVQRRFGTDKNGRHDASRPDPTIVALTARVPLRSVVLVPGMKPLKALRFPKCVSRLKPTQRRYACAKFYLSLKRRHPVRHDHASQIACLSVTYTKC